MKSGVGPATRLSQRASVSDESGMFDRRRWTSFLTWAFVLGEMAGRDGLLPTAAHAGDDDLGRVSHPGSDTAPIVNTLPNINVSTATDAPEPVTYQHAPSMPSYMSTQLSSELGAAKITTDTDEVGHGQGGGWVGGADSHADAASASDGTIDTGSHLPLGDGPFLAFAHDGAPLDLGLHLDPSGLLGDVVDGLGSLPLVGGPLEDVGNTLASTTGNLLSLVGLSGGGAGALSYGNDVGTPGQIAFADSVDPVAAHELATPSGYTTYGIALNLGPSVASPASGEAAAHADSLDASGLDNQEGHLTGNDLDTSSDALHLDQSLLRIASDVLA